MYKYCSIMMIWNEQNKVFSTISKENYIPSQGAGTRYIYCNSITLRSDQRVSQTFYVRGTICDNASTSLKLWRTLSGNQTQDV